MNRIFIFLFSVCCIFGLISCSSRSKEVEIDLQLNSYEKEGIPYTDVTFITKIDNEEEKILIGSYMGEGNVLDTFEDRAFFKSDSLVGCQVYYAGGADNVFAYIEDGDIIVKHIEFVTGSDEIDSEIIDEKIVVTKDIPKKSTIRIVNQKED